MIQHILRKLYKKNREINTNLYNKLENGEDLEYDDIQETKYYVPKTSKLVNSLKEQCIVIKFLLLDTSNEIN